VALESEQMSCAVCCGAVWRSMVAGAFVEWVHASAHGDTHPVLAVPTAAVESLGWCDSCSERAVWMFPLEPFPLPGVGPIKHTLPVWAACDVCWHLVTTRQWGVLTTRVAHGYRTVCNVPASVPDAVLRARLQSLWLALATHITGPAVRIVVPTGNEDS
jgi:hypothetical protein